MEMRAPSFTPGERVSRRVGDQWSPPCPLWDCLSLIDGATIAVVKKFGPLAAISNSHPHSYTTMVEWSAALGDVPVHLHAAGRECGRKPDQRVQFREGNATPLFDDLRPLIPAVISPGSRCCIALWAQTPAAYCTPVINRASARIH
jgi:hypothetical protein